MRRRHRHDHPGRVSTNSSTLSPTNRSLKARQYLYELRAEESLSEEMLAAVREGLEDIENGRVMDAQEYRRTRGV
jgi:predicted transcriptional regulator